MAQTGKTRKPPKKSKSVLKRQRQNAKRRVHNASALAALHTEINKFNALLQGKELEKSRAFMGALISRVAHLSSKGILKKGTASRKISRLNRRFNEFFAAKAR
ncbi:MAG: 30S ribosomal protein S20 [Deltaproteobacteria bacterium]|nr:30S ribosomal protein S20 [Deltaproteobacteria bacterium]MCL5276785.1 30S ribosomal protein S20 [Deltaproteobacteria bacterium]